MSSFSSYYKSTGEVFPFEHFQPPWQSGTSHDEPDGGSKQNCASMNFGEKMQIYDIPCDDGGMYHLICEFLKPIISVPVGMSL